MGLLFFMMRVKADPPQENLGRCPRLVEVALSGHKIRIDLSRFPVSVILAYAGIQKYSQPSMEPRIREVDFNGGCKV